MLGSPGTSPDWVVEFDELMKEHINSYDHQYIVDLMDMGSVAKMAHPTHEHFLPLLYALGLRTERDELAYFNDSFDFGSISMRSVLAEPGA